MGVERPHFSHTYRVPSASTTNNESKHGQKTATHVDPACAGRLNSLNMSAGDDQLSLVRANSLDLIKLCRQGAVEGVAAALASLDRDEYDLNFADRNGKNCLLVVCQNGGVSASALPLSPCDASILAASRRCPDKLRYSTSTGSSHVHHRVFLQHAASETKSNGRSP